METKFPRLFGILAIACFLVGTAFGQAAPVPIAQGSPVSLTASADGTAPFTYKWTKGTAVLSQTTATITFTSITPADAATYSCVISNAFGSATASVALVIGQPPTNPKISVVQQLIAWLREHFGRNKT